MWKRRRPKKINGHLRFFYTTIFVYPSSPQTQSDKYMCFFGKLINLVKTFYNRCGNTRNRLWAWFINGTIIRVCWKTILCHGVAKPACRRKLSGHLSIETEIVVQRKWSVIFKNLAFTTKNITINHYLSDFFILFQQTLNIERLRY